jgi:CheY-like chemotaxis protein
MNRPHLDGLRVLIAEDQAIVAMEIEDVLREAGCEVLGPVVSLQSALALLEQTMPDIAILDVNLEGALSFPLAESLRARGIPVILATGYMGRSLPVEWQQTPLLSKPFNRTELEDALADLIDRRRR